MLTSDEVIMLSLAGVSLCLKTASSIGLPAGPLLKVMVDGRGEVHLFADEAMEKKHTFVYYPNSWMKGAK